MRSDFLFDKITCKNEKYFQSVEKARLCLARRFVHLIRLLRSHLPLEGKAFYLTKECFFLASP